ncbi:hypothetical protein LQE92_05310 [Lacrimispora sp. NSJ-141]|uniref:Uncharacterized protein n=1 Tax=Lientehia hominis TaxID=2897778 RepID=A0AAP2W752_9FIRM|nr:hypothetical protein [Lientehia hominis]
MVKSYMTVIQPDGALLKGFQHENFFVLVIESLELAFWSALFCDMEKFSGFFCDTKGL